MLKKQKNKESCDKKLIHDVFYENVIIAQIITYKDYVKNEESDKVRTKYTRLQDVVWNKNNLFKVFPNKQKQIKEFVNHYKIESKEGSASFWIQASLGKLINFE
jgi:hypothetical protein